MTLHDFVDAAIRYCAMTSASVTSWGRTTIHNAAVGGVSHSAHRYWLGLDVVYDAAALPEFRLETASRLGLRLIAEGDHDHLQPTNWPKG